MRDDDVKPCVQCGYCCTVRTCSYGFYGHSQRNVLCRHLVRNEQCVRKSGTPLTTYTCNIWDKIKYMEKGSPYPMCGSGCSSTLCNVMRDKVIEVIKEMAVERMTR